MPTKLAAWYAFLSNLPQPTSALASFGCMQFATNELAVPIGLGMASGAMSYVVFKELVPEALEKVSTKQGVPVMLISGLLVLMFDACNHFTGHGPAETMSSFNVGAEL